MKILLSLFLSSACTLNVNSQFTYFGKPVMLPGSVPASETKKESTVLNFQEKPGSGRMSAIQFKSQEFCRAELENFDFDARFSVIGATVYFSGASFKNVEIGAITSSSLKSIAGLMKRCQPGSVVVFDKVKVVGPDKEVRTIQGLSLMLY